MGQMLSKNFIGIDPQVNNKLEHWVNEFLARNELCYSTKNGIFLKYFSNMKHTSLFQPNVCHNILFKLRPLFRVSISFCSWGTCYCAIFIGIDPQVHNKLEHWVNEF